jgi:prepilin-type N-terminal cleavage/methylation domain-containing protein
MSISIRKNNKGFTLIELLVVMSIIAILGTVGITAYVGSTLKAARSEAYGNLSALSMFEAQFSSENAIYTASAANVAAIQALLPGFRPGNVLNYNYAITQNRALVLPVTVPSGATVAQTPCFVATATGIAGTRVAGDIFAIDCNNNKNF